MLKQKFEAVGRLVAKPEMRYTPSGTAVSNVRVAIEDGYWSTDEGKWISRTIWATLSFWGKLAEGIAEKGNKGDQIVFIGGLVYDVKIGAPQLYERSDGSSAAKFEFRVTEYQLFPKGGNGSATPSNPQGDDAPAGTEEEYPF
jgi:single-strand DNA-binding protein